MTDNDPKPSKKADWNQEDVLKNKDHVTQGSRGLQIWGDEATPDSGHAGTATQGTAERQASIKRGQDAMADATSGNKERMPPAGGKKEEPSTSEGQSFSGEPDRSREQPT